MYSGKRGSPQSLHLDVGFPHSKLFTRQVQSKYCIMFYGYSAELFGLVLPNSIKLF